MNSNSNFSTNCTSASSSPSQSPVSFGSAASPIPLSSKTSNQANHQLTNKTVASLNSVTATTNQHTNQHILSNIHLAQQALHQANVSSLMTNHPAHQLTTNTSNQTAQAQSTLVNLANNNTRSIDLTSTVGLNAQFNQFFPLHHQFWQTALNDPFYRPFVS